jgi:hypothetical protein
MTQTPIGGAFAERDVDHELRHNPGGAARIGHFVGEGGFLLAGLAQHGMQPLELSVAEAGADTALIVQRRTVPAAQQQGAEALARAGRPGVSADHEFAVLRAFDLQPRLAAAAAVA